MQSSEIRLFFRILSLRPHMDHNNIISSANVKLRVSSTLNNLVKEYGKEFMLDGSEETCWNSHQGSPQWIIITWNFPATLHEIKIMFQGGFAGKDCEFLAIKEGEDSQFKSVGAFHPTDTNELQTFSCNVDRIKQLKIVFHSSTDFFGRVTIYKLMGS